jgi:Acetyltransferase (GNAT) domain
VLSVVSAAEVGPTFEDWQNDSSFLPIAAHPVTGGFGRSYYRELAGDGYVDRRFAVIESDTPVLIVLCGFSGASLGYFGMPVRVFPRSGMPPESIGSATATAFRKIDEIALADNLTSANVADFDSGTRLSAIGKQCLNRGAAATVHIGGTCDLRNDETTLRRGLRKSYRSLINWGERNLKMEFVNRENADYSLFRQYQDLHKAVAGRSTRSQKSWDIMFEWIAGGRGELVLGYLKSEELVAGTLVVDGAEIASYASGAYDRDRFDMPISHWPLWLAIKRSAERGRATFDLGELPVAAADRKEADIGFFKRGFTDVFPTWMSWNWNVQPRA